MKYTVGEQIVREWLGNWVHGTDAFGKKIYTPEQIESLIKLIDERLNDKETDVHLRS
jgi:hypothetical protein